MAYGARKLGGIGKALTKKRTRKATPKLSGGFSPVRKKRGTGGKKKGASARTRIASARASGNKGAAAKGIRALRTKR